jgi:hypothetical protein
LSGQHSKAPGFAGGYLLVRSILSWIILRVKSSTPKILTSKMSNSIRIKLVFEDHLNAATNELLVATFSGVGTTSLDELKRPI